MGYCRTGHASADRAMTKPPSDAKEVVSFSDRKRATTLTDRSRSSAAHLSIRRGKLLSSQLPSRLGRNLSIRGRGRSERRALCAAPRLASPPRRARRAAAVHLAGIVR
eukprot:6204280-Pleurochrysis_carterae.AAC.3